jgi:hypothetical protein
MTSVKRMKSLQEKYVHVRLSEHDLRRLALIIKDLGKNYSNIKQNDKDWTERFEIKVKSADEEDEYTVEEPDFIISYKMPRKIRSVEISYRFDTFGSLDSLVNCSVDFNNERFSFSRGVIVHVKGIDTNAAVTVFHNLKRELEDHQLFGASYFRALHELSVGVLFVSLIVFGLVCAISSFFVFDLPLDWAAEHIGGFKNSDLHQFLTGVGGAVIVLAFMGGGYWIVDMLTKVFPPIQFSGSIEDTGARSRSRIFLTLGTILIPILLEIISRVLGGP